MSSSHSPTAEAGGRHPPGPLRRSDILTGAGLLLFAVGYLADYAPFVLQRSLSREWYLRPAVWFLVASTVALAAAMFFSIVDGGAKPSDVSNARPVPRWAYWWAVGVGLVVSFWFNHVDAALLDRPGYSRFLFLLAGWILPGPIVLGSLVGRFRGLAQIMLAFTLAVASSVFAWALLLYLLPALVFGGP